MNVHAVQDIGVDTPPAISTCRLCGTVLVHTLVDLGMSPPCEKFLAVGELADMEPTYPLHVLVCAECLLVQIAEHVSPQSIFEEYAYFSSYSDSWVEHARRYCVASADRYGLNGESLVVELASNDGYLLQHFIAMGIPSLGVEPALNVAKVAVAKGIPTITEFFGTPLAEEMISLGKQADLIVGNNVLAQVPDLNDFVGGMKMLLKPEGVITLEFPHIAKLIAENQFDTIYHEHFSYFSLLTIEKLAKRHGLKVFDVDEIPTHGGSLRVHLAHVASAHVGHSRVDELRLSEFGAGLDMMETYTDFGATAEKAKRNLLSFLIRLKSMGMSICAYGAPGKGNTLLNYCGIGRDFIDFAVDRNPYKHGRFTPGMHIPIFPVSEIDVRKPDYILILPWNLKGEIVAQMAHVAEWGGKFVVPIPDVAIIDTAEAGE